MNEIQRHSMKMLVALINYKGDMLDGRPDEPFKLYGAKYLLESLIGVVRIAQKNRYDTLLQGIEEELRSSSQKKISQQTKTDIYELSVLAQTTLLSRGLKDPIFTVDEFITELEKMV